MSEGAHDDLTAALRDRLLGLLAEVEQEAGDLPRDAFDRLRRSARGEFRIGVVGRVKAGKSTLVNALVGDEVAPTSAEEKTRVVTEFRYGAPRRAQLVLRTGERLAVPFRQGIPDELPRPAAEISHAEVFVPAEPLRRFVLVDTPGLSTSTAENEAATRRAVLGDGTARSRVDALIYLFRDNEFRDDVDFLAAYSAVRAREGAPTVVLGALAHADEYGSGPWGDRDPLPAAAERAEAIAARHAELSGVVPLAGKLAEAARLVLLTESDARLLGTLGDLDDDALQLRVFPQEVRVGEVDRLAAVLSEYGLRFGRARARSGLRALLGWMEDLSGIRPLAARLGEGAFGSRVEQRAGEVLRELEQLVRGSSRSLQLRRAIHAARLEPALHPIRANEALETLRRASPGHPLVEDLTRLLEGGDLRSRLGLPAGADDGETRQGAIDLAVRARRTAALASSGAEEVAGEAVAQFCMLILQRLT